LFAEQELEAINEGDVFLPGGKKKSTNRDAISKKKLPSSIRKSLLGSKNAQIGEGGECQQHMLDPQTRNAERE